MYLFSSFAWKRLFCWIHVFKCLSFIQLNLCEKIYIVQLYNIKWMYLFFFFLHGSVSFVEYMYFIQLNLCEKITKSELWSFLRKMRVWVGGCVCVCVGVCVCVCVWYLKIFYSQVLRSADGFCKHMSYVRTAKHSIKTIFKTKLIEWGYLCTVYRYHSIVTIDCRGTVWWSQGIVISSYALTARSGDRAFNSLLTPRGFSEVRVVPSHWVYSAAIWLCVNFELVKRWMDWWMDGWMDGWIDGWIGQRIYERWDG
jgi:hypothetical protein